MNPDSLTVADFPIGRRVRVRDIAYPTSTRGKIGSIVEPTDSNTDRWPLRVLFDDGSTEHYSPRELEPIVSADRIGVGSLDPVDTLRRKAKELRAQADALDAAIAVLEQ